MCKVVSISGGRSSAMMLKILKDNGQIDESTIVVFANTGKESEATLKFINECSTRWDIDTVWLEYTNESPRFKIVNYETAARNGEPFAALIDNKNYLPNPVKRICTAELKIKTIRRFIRSLGIKGHFDTFLGLRYDERERVSKKKAQNAAGKEPEFCIMPLYELRVTVKERDTFWKNQGFDLEISSHIDNCDLCFLKGKWNIIWAIRENPKMAEWWIEQETKISNSKSKFKKKRNEQFRKEYSYTELRHIALTQTFIPQPGERTISITCNCTD